MKYLIAVDASDNSRFAFRQAKKNFFTEKDHVYILTVTENPSSYPFEDIFNFSRETYNEMNTKIENMFSELLKQYGRELTRVGIPHTCLIARGTIRDVICRQTQDLCVDVLIMGRRGMGTLERAFMGSTSQYCVHNVNCSVIVIPFTAKDKLSPTSSEEVLNSEEEFERLEEKEGKGEGYIIQKKCEHPECSADSCSFKNTCRSPSCKDLTCTDAECRDPSCKNAECIKCSKFSKLGQYEREKWQGKGEMKVGFEGSQFGESIPEASKFGVSKAKSDGSKFQKAKSEGSKFQSKFEVPKSKVEERKVTEEKQKCLQCESDVCEKHGKWQGKECNDPLCNKAECMKHGKFQGKSQEKYECNDPLCNKAECMKHGKGALENKGKGVDVNEGSYAAVSGGKSYAAIVEKAEEKYGDDVTDKSEHKGAINVGAGKVEGKVTNQKDSQGNWKETKVDVGFKGKDEKGSEYQGKKYEATIESK